MGVLSLSFMHKPDQNTYPSNTESFYTTVLLLPDYNYADTTWSGLGISNEKKVQTTQNIAARSIVGKIHYSSATEALKTLNFTKKVNTRSSICTTVTTWNSVPVELRCAATTTTFKNSYQTYVVNKYNSKP